MELEYIYQDSKDISNIDNIPSEIESNLIKIGEGCHKNKGVYTVTVTLLYYKINNPKQDIRLHQNNMINGFSGRSFDKKHVTPVLSKLGLPAMAESGWLTRSLEQPYPYDLNYNGKISGGLKDIFLQTLDYVEQNPLHAENMLRILINKVISMIETNSVTISHLNNADKLSIDDIAKMLNEHFNYKYKTHNGAKLPVLAFYAIYKCIIDEVARYKGCSLANLSSLTACDLTSKTSGDIEIFNNDGRLFEAVEIKLNKEIDSSIVRIAKNKIYKYNPKRYYILSSTGVSADEKEDIDKIISEVKNDHGCQIIVNGLIPTIKYYLRLISSSDKFMNIYTEAILVDIELQKIHKEVWKEIINRELK